MPARRRIDPAAGRAALAAWAATREPTLHAPGAATAPDFAPVPDRAMTATAVRFALEELAEVAPGRSLEVRVPPFGAVQCVEGSVHRRGTPPAVVEMAPDVWLGLVTGRLRWDDAVAAGDVDASGERSDLSALLPLSA